MSENDKTVAALRDLADVARARGLHQLAALADRLAEVFAEDVDAPLELEAYLEAKG